MPLFAGTHLGHYDVTSLLGEGGMGQVWQATDTQPPERLTRLEREVRQSVRRDAGLPGYNSCWLPVAAGD